MEDRDRVILSNGHICPVWYATLAHAGFFLHEELMTLRKLNSRLQGHPHYRELPGVENTGRTSGARIVSGDWSCPGREDGSKRLSGVLPNE